jgi:hypothetical protein
MKILLRSTATLDKPNELYEKQIIIPARPKRIALLNAETGDVLKVSEIDK